MTTTNTMVYSPEIMVIIGTKDGNINVSDDIVSGKITRRIDAASDFALTLNNRRTTTDANLGKYTGKIQRMDRVAIFMKRLHWVQVFSGYVQVVPVFDLYPNTCVITGICTLTRLQNFYWNPYMPASREIMAQEFYRTKSPSGERDSGIGNMLLNIVTKVGNWGESTVHIQNLPDKFLDFAKAVKLTDETSAQQQETLLGKIADLMGVGAAAIQGAINGSVSGTLNASATSIVPGGPNVTYTMDQLVAQAYVVGIPNGQLATAAAIAWAESSGVTGVISKPNTNGSRDYGLWQINDSHKSASYVPNGDMNTMLDPGNNAKAMFAISNGGIEWKWWSTFSKGLYLPYMARAKEAVARFDPSTLTTSNSQVPATTGTTTPGTSVTDAANSNAAQGGSGNAVGTVNAIIAAGVTQLGVKYSYGGGSLSGPSNGDSGAGFDCSSLMRFMVYNGTNKAIDISRSTSSQWSSKLNGHGYQVPINAVKRGDLIYYSSNGAVSGIHHVAMVTGPDQYIEAPNTGSFVRVKSPLRTADAIGALRVIGVVDSGGVINIPENGGAATVTGANGNTSGFTSNEPLASAMFRIQFLGNADASRNVLYEDDSLILTEPLFNTVKTVASAGMRSIMSAPNGDFVAFYPDQFGIMGKSPAVEIQDVELINFNISLNTSELTTHVFTAINPDVTNGTVDNTAWQGLYHTSVGIEDKEIMKVLLNISDIDKELNPGAFYAKYGVRPLKITNGDIKDQTLNYFQAIYAFLQKWSDQFNSRVEMTFMPELYPGMRVRIASKGVTFYVKEVTHEFDFNTGFTTSAIVNSPTTEKGGIPGMVLG